MSFEYSLEELLNLALRTPEIGAVNFNYLYEVLHEILKHLGISNKIAGCAIEAGDDRIQGLSARSTPLPDVLEERSEDDVFENVSNDQDLVEKQKDGDEVNGNKQHRSTAKETKNSKPQEEKHNDKSNVGADQDKKCRKEVSKNVNERDAPIEKQNVNAGEAQRRDSIASTRSTANAGEMQRGSPSPPMRGHSGRRGSNISAAFSDRRHSQMLSGNEPISQSNHDLVLINRSLERRDSKTPAGDMWHVLNINRRLEATEATIQGITSLIDNVSTDMLDMKEAIENIQENNIAVKDHPSPPAAEVPKAVKNTEISHDMQAVNSEISKLAKAVSKIETEIKETPTKSDLQDFCTMSVVEELIEEKLAARPPASSSKSNTANVDQPPKRRESRTKLFQEIANRIMKLEEAGVLVNTEIQSLQQALSAKPNHEDFIEKLSHEIELLGKEISTLQSGENEVKSMKEKLSQLSEDIKSLTLAAEGNSKEQTILMRNVIKVEKDLESLTDTVHTKLGTNVNVQAVQAENDAITKLRAAMNGVIEQHGILEDDIHRIDRDLKKTNEKAANLDETIDGLKATKIDKTGLEELLKTKADQNALHDKISQSHFDACVGNLDKNLQDALQRVDGQDSILKQFVNKFDNKLEKKLDRDNLHNVKELIENRIKSLKMNVPEPTLPEEAAAGFRKPLLRNFHCISCDRPLELLQEDAIPTLPVCQALPGSRAIRPYTTFELEQIRKHMRGIGSNRDRFELAQEREKLQKQLLRLCGACDLDDLTAKASRSCGGSHTLLDSQKRTMVKATMSYREDSLQIQAATEPALEGEVMGRDGHIYKGRIEHLPPLKQKDVPKSSSQTDVPIMARPSLQHSKTEIGTHALTHPNRA